MANEQSQPSFVLNRFRIVLIQVQVDTGGVVLILRRPWLRRPCVGPPRVGLVCVSSCRLEKSCSSSPAAKEKVCAGQALTFNEPHIAGPELAGQILHVILLEGLHKKSGSSALSRAQVARDASQGRSLKLGCAMCCRGRSLGKRSCSLKLCDWPALPKMY